MSLLYLSLSFGYSRPTYNRTRKLPRLHKCHHFSQIPEFTENASALLTWQIRVVFSAYPPSSHNITICFLAMVSHNIFVSMIESNLRLFIRYLYKLYVDRIQEENIIRLSLNYLITRITVLSHTPTLIPYFVWIVFT